MFLARCFVKVLQESKCLFLSVSSQRVRMERSGAARGDPDVTAPVPIGAVQCRSLPTASLLRRQQDQSRGLYLCVCECLIRISVEEKGMIKATKRKLQSTQLGLFCIFLQSLSRKSALTNQFHTDVLHDKACRNLRP